MATVRLSRLAAVVAFTVSLGAAPSAQQPMSDVLQFLVTNQSVGTGSPDRDLAAARATSDTIGRALLASLATLPVSSSSGAFAYRLNPELGTVERATTSFGPLFTERALSTGRGASSFGLTLQHFRFTTLDDRDLRDGTLVTTANQFVDETSPFDVDRLALEIDADVTTLYANVGLSDRLEVGIAAPLVALRMNGSRINTYRGRTFTEATASATAVGLADLVGRAKFALFAAEGLGLATAAEVRVPTGKRADLLGAGSAALRLSAIGSIERRRVSAHVNLGGAVGGLANEVSASVAASIAASDRMTLVAELLGRRLDGPGGIVTVTAPHPSLKGVQTARLGTAGSGLTTVTAAPGLKWNVVGTWVLVANVAIPLTHNGLIAPVTPFVGIDWSPGR